MCLTNSCQPLEHTNLGGAVCIKDPDGSVLEMVGYQQGSFEPPFLAQL